MKFKLLPGRRIGSVIALFIFSLAALAQEFVPSPSFRNFDQRARAGETMVVVFFGGGLTWGEGASDPERTSFRALLQDYLKHKYSEAHFVFHDSAVGGTGSKLGMFRVEQDVIAHHPDLVFVDFTVEDNPDGTDRETLASYERILRDLIYEGIPVVEVIAGTKDKFGPGWTHLGPPRHRDHVVMGNLYHTGVGDIFPLVQSYLQNDLHSRDQIWPNDETYPGDLGHRLLFEATRDSLEQCIRRKEICRMPVEPVFANEYTNRFQFFPAAFDLPAGWRVAKTLRPDIEIVTLANAWKSQVALCDGTSGAVKPLQLGFNGTFLGVLGEADEHGLGFKVAVDGRPLFYDAKTRNEVWPTSTVPFGGGERFFWHEISDKLPSGHHRVEILPVFPEGTTKGALRIESLCVAGPDTVSAQSISWRARGH